jgi:hypothetical protein
VENTIVDWIKSNYGWALSLIIQSITAYHIYFLSRRISLNAKLGHKRKIKQKANKLLAGINRDNLNSEVYLVNVERYFKDYPSNKEKIFEGYSHLKAELKSTRYDGVEFFVEAPREVYKKSSGELSFNGVKSDKVFNVFPVGIVPYEWIEDIDDHGDEFSGVPLFYCYYRGKSNWNFWKRLRFYKFPYKKILYYRIRETYQKNNDPFEMKYSYVSEKISNK